MSLFEKLNETGVPKFFWYTLSLILITLAVGFLWISYKSQSISIEIANTKIELVSSITQVEKAYENLKTEQVKLQTAKEEFQKHLSDANSKPENIKPIKIDTIDSNISLEMDDHISKLRDMRKIYQQSAR